MEGSWLRKAWSRLWAPTTTPDPVLNAECPVCRRPVAVGSNTYMGSAWSGPMMLPWTPEELTRACSVHGRAPANAGTIKALEKRAREGEG